jgi:hypothetical protein
MAALPNPGVLVADRSLGGVRLGDTPAHVRRLLGRSYGLCRGCARTTWYFTYRRFDDEGLAVEFSGRRVSGVYTLWAPPRWHGPRGVTLGDEEGSVTSKVGAVVPIACSNYTALVHGGDVYYIVEGQLWGFGLFRRGRSPCR